MKFERLDVKGTMLKNMLHTSVNEWRNSQNYMELIINDVFWRPLFYFLQTGVGKKLRRLFCLHRDVGLQDAIIPENTIGTESIELPLFCCNCGREWVVGIKDLNVKFKGYACIEQSDNKYAAYEYTWNAPHFIKDYICRFTHKTKRNKYKLTRYGRIWESYMQQHGKGGHEYKYFLRKLVVVDSLFEGEAS